MKCCAVVDTNVLVAALLSKRDDSATAAGRKKCRRAKKKNKYAATKAGRSIGLTDRCFLSVEFLREIDKMVNEAVIILESDQRASRGKNNEVLCNQRAAGRAVWK